MTCNQKKKCIITIAIILGIIGCSASLYYLYVTIYTKHDSPIPIETVAHKIKNIALQELETSCPIRGFRGIDHICLNNTNKLSNQQHLSVRLGIGWDPITGQVKLPVFHESFNLQKKYVTNSGITYLVPDQTILTKKNLSIPTRFTNTYHLPSDFFNQIDTDRTTIKGGIFATDKDLYQMIIDYFGIGEQTMTVVQEIHTTYELTYTNETIQLGTSFSKALNYLPKQYKGNEEIYNLFLYYWGTNVVLSANAGGMAEQITNIKECFYVDSLDVGHQAILTMLKTLYAKDYSHINYMANYLQFSRANILEIYGGNPVIFNTNDWSKRLLSFDDYPVFTQVTVKSILEFISDPIIRDNVRNAINTYYQSGILLKNNLVNNWNNMWYANKPITSMPTVLTPSPIVVMTMHWHTPHWQVTITDADPSSTFNLQQNGFQNVDKCANYPVASNFYMNACSYMWSDIRQFQCRRDENGLTYALFTGVNPELPWYTYNIDKHPPPQIVMVISEGQHVKQGASHIDGYLITKFGQTVFRHYCVTGCNPVIADIQTTNSPVIDLTFGNFKCDCVPF